MSSSKLINKLENLELLKTSVPPTTVPSTELPSEPRPAYEIFGNLENLILYSDSDEDSDVFMPVVDGKCLHAHSITDAIVIPHCFS